MAKPLMPFGAFPVGLLPGWAFPGGGGYLLYRGAGGPTSIDYDDPVAGAQAGQGSIDLTGLGHVAGTEYFYGVRAVSDSGVREANTDRTVRVLVDDGGDLVGPPPNAITSALARPSAGGKITLAFTYVGGPAAGIASGIQVARIVAGAPDWDNLVQTIAIAGAARRSVELTPTYGHGEPVTLAIRAVTADGAVGPAYRLPTVVADAIGPEPIAYLEAEQA